MPDIRPALLAYRCDQPTLLGATGVVSRRAGVAGRGCALAPVPVEEVGGVVGLRKATQVGILKPTERLSLGWNTQLRKTKC